MLSSVIASEKSCQSYLTDFSIDRNFRSKSNHFHALFTKRMVEISLDLFSKRYYYDSFSLRKVKNMYNISLIFIFSPKNPSVPHQKTPQFHT